MARLFRRKPKRETPTPAPAVTSAEYEIPWRPVIWNNSTREFMLRELKRFHLRTSDISCLKIMLHGPIGAGKSSFINSVNTTLQGRITTVALAETNAGTSFTTKLKIHKLKTGEPGCFYPFVFTDIMGLEPGQGHGVHTDDIFRVLCGEIKNGYTFNPEYPIAEANQHFKPDPSLKDKIHCLVSVLPADKIPLISEDVFKKMKHVHKMAHDLGIPEVIIMSMVDKACPLVNDDLKKIYISKNIRKKIEECSKKSGVPVDYIYPVKNYSEEVNTDIDKDILILKAIDNIVRLASYYVEHQDYLHQ